MAISQRLAGYAFLSDGTAISGATVELFASLAGTPSSVEQSTTTDANGYWTFVITAAKQYDVKVSWASGTQVRWHKGLSVVGVVIPTVQSANLALPDTTLTNTDMTVAVNSGEIWAFHGMVHTTFGGTDVNKIALDVPAASTLLLNVLNQSDNLSTTVDATAVVLTANAGGNIISGFVVAGAAGSITLQIAKNADAGANNQLDLGSHLIFTRVK